jgi:hypothetical protein
MYSTTCQHAYSTLTFVNKFKIKIYLKKKMYRHGDRTPALSYPNSPVDPSSWPNGYGQLTLRGRVQQIRLGKYFRERYSELLNSTYVASEVSE